MRAAIFHEIGKPLSIETVADPAPASGQAVIKLARCGICGSDLHMTSDPNHVFPCNSIPGHELSGEVVALGPDIRHLRVGDAVTAMAIAGCGQCVPCLTGRMMLCAQRRMPMGGFGEYAAVQEDCSIRLPEGLALDDGALIEPLACGLRNVVACDVQPGERVVVLGAGAMGLAAAFWARRRGAGPIAMVARSTWRAPIAEQMGVTHFIRSSDRLSEEVNDALGGPPDIVFECIGLEGMLDLAVQLVRSRGTVGGLGGHFAPDVFVPGKAMLKEVRIIFTAAYDLHEFRHTADVLARGADEARAMVTDTIPLSALPNTLEMLRGKHQHCKILVKPGLP
ncbi:alcohol dehydrogenase [Sphingobium lactosutens]|uniref:alcohol dehydrogenase catalytic domain-containing protein n=1 Tax=Sphingobium lactosutens TaxID=522773 RepID=UPI0015BE4C40|nr:alcohol dehydrogenase catalytic domain-containing protein [Sphingobium lactosutens]NWK97857.1 alcohol dehydrogenase [Sphingobium lactosutens]